MSKQREAEGVNEDKFREMKSADRRPVQQKVSGMRARWGHQENGWVGSGMADAVGQVNGMMEVGAWDGTCILQDPQIIKDGHSGQGRAAGGFSELAVAVVMVMVMSLVVVAMVFVLSVEGSCDVVDDEGRAHACANRGDDGSWHGDVGT